MIPHVIDVTAITGQKILGPVTSWQTPDGLHTVEHLAGVSPGGDLLVFFWSPRHDWQVVNVSQKTGHKVSGPLTSWTTPDGSMIVEHIAGRAPNGNLLVFFWSPQHDWQAIDVTQKTGQKIASPLTNWQTPDGQLNVEHLAGVSPEGDLLVFFWSPRHDWQVVNVSQKTGHKVSGPVTSWVTHDGPRLVEHLAGRAHDGSLYVFFWSPAQDWQVVDVSQITGQKMASSVKSWVVSGVEHLAGQAPDNSLLVFWWTPSTNWRAVNVSAIAGGSVIDAPSPYRLSVRQNTIELLGARRPDGSLVIYWWSPSSNWQVMDLSEVSEQRVVSAPETWLTMDGQDTVEHLAAEGPNNALVVFWFRCFPPLEGQSEIMWSSGVVGIHAALLHTGKVLFWSYKEPWDLQKDHGVSSVLDLSNGAVALPQLDRDLFCAGQSSLSDGRVFVGGGERQTRGFRSIHTFTPDGPNGGAWQYLGELPDGRWYPTCTTLPSGKVLIIGGRDFPSGSPDFANTTYEIFDPNTGLQAPSPAPVIAQAGDGFATYPFVLVLPSGKLLIHAGMRTGFLDPTTGIFENTLLATVRPIPRTYSLEGSCVLLPLSPASNPPYRARVMLIGGGGQPPSTTTLATNTCEILDFGLAPLAWRGAANMPHRRVMPDAVLLPDATVLVTNGSSAGKADDAADPVFDVDIYEPSANSWMSMCPMRVPRLYHATALLLPDGRVLTAGTDARFNQEFHLNASELRLELFSPPYMFRGHRPSIITAPSDLVYGAQFDVETPDGSTIATASFIRLGAVTHSFNMDQRYVELEKVSQSAGKVTLRAPPNANIAPPGYYMLFLLNRERIPSIARFVRLHPPIRGPP